MKLYIYAENKVVSDHESYKCYKKQILQFGHIKDILYIV